MSLYRSVTLPLTNRSGAGEQGKVDESMREMAAIEALKSEKSDKEVRRLHFRLFSDVDINISINTARTPTTDRYVWSIRTSEVACVRRLRCLPFSSRLRSSSRRPFRRKGAWWLWLALI